MIPDQKQLWDKKHNQGEHESFRGEASPFAQLAEAYIQPHSELLELGCGVGRDAVFFAAKGHQVLATDFSAVIIKRNKQEIKRGSVNFEELDMQQSFPFEDDKFNAVYANLSLHYYTHEVTKQIIREIARTLKPGGVLAFACKSTNDFHHGNGKEVEKDFFVSEKGHARHLFTKDYAQGLVREKFNTLLLEEVEEIYSGQKSVMIQCIAQKKG